jgi:ABC-type glycerol-3-phosphate transport system substrate-binding protein
MKGTIAIVFGALCCLSAVAMITRPSAPFTDRLALVRTTDSNPNRTKEAEGFAALNPTLGLQLDYSSNNIQKIIVQCSSGVGPDLYDTYGGTQLQTYVSSGIAQDVTKEAKELGFSIDGDTWPAVRGELSLEGVQYSYPANVNADILIYNKALFDRFGVPYPKQNITWDEFFELAKKMTRGEGANKVYGITPLSSGLFYETMRGEIFSPDGTKLLITGKQMQTAFQMYHDLIYKHKVAPSSLDMKAMAGQGGWGSGSINQFCDGRFAMINVGKWALANFRTAHKDQLEKWEKTGKDPEKRKNVLRLGSVLLPHHKGMKQSYTVSARSVTINALGTNKKEALQFMKFLASKEYSTIVNEAVDALPGNPKFANVGLTEGNPELEEMEMHRNTIKAMEYGYQRRLSPFLLASDVDRILKVQISRMESDQSLKIPELLADAQTELEALMQRNLDRDPNLRERYKELTGSDRVGENR